MKTLIALLTTAAFLLPASASAMPLDNGPAPPMANGTPAAPATAPAPQSRTIIRDNGDALPIVIAGTALLVALTTAGYSTLRLAPARRAHS
jgi:hypothetical protein